MKNVIIIAVDSERYAVELRWVREVITLGYVTRVPGAPAHVAGAINVRGAITAVLDISALPGEARGQSGPAGQVGQAGSSRPPRWRHDREGDVARNGDGAVLIDVEGVAMALRMSTVEEVSTVSESPGHDSAGPGIVAGAVVDSRGREVALLDPPELVRLTLAMSKRELPALPLESDTSPAARVLAEPVP